MEKPLILYRKLFLCDFQEVYIVRELDILPGRVHVVQYKMVGTWGVVLGSTKNKSYVWRRPKSSISWNTTSIECHFNLITNTRTPHTDTCLRRIQFYSFIIYSNSSLLLSGLSFRFITDKSAISPKLHWDRFRWICMFGAEIFILGILIGV